MATITSLGVGSGLDVESIVSSLMSVEKQPLALLQQQATDTQTQISAFGSLKSQIATLESAAATLADKSNWNPVSVTSSDTTAVSATGTSAATIGNHSVEVSQLAQGQILVAAGVASSTSVIGTGTLQIEFGTSTGTTFSPQANSSPISISIGASNQTLAGICQAINAKAAGVAASVVSSGGVSRLVLQGPNGSQNTMRITVQDNDGSNTDTAGLSSLAWDPAGTAGNGKNLGQTQAAQDAVFKFDGIDLTNSSNTVTDLLPGLNLALKKTTSSPVSVAIASDPVALRKNVSDFVKAYNDLNKLIRSQTQADPTGQNRGPLQADSTANGVRNGMRSVIQGAVAGLTGAASLSAVGIEVQSDGSLSINETKFATVLTTPSQLAALFTQTATGSNTQTAGIGVRLKSWADALDSDTGPLATRTDGLQRRQQANDKAQTAMQDRLTQTEARLRAQYQSLDTEMSRLKASMASLTQLTG